jgi:acetyl esterase/lipase
MASEASHAIRALFPKEYTPPTTPLATQRREWEEEALRAELPPGTAIEPALAHGVACEWVRGAQAARDQVVLYAHGGGFNAGSCKTHRELAARISNASGASVLLVDYRLAPEHPFPAGLEDMVSAYRWLLGQSIEPRRIAIGGDSAGGGLAISTLLALRDARMPLPAAAVIISPWLDLALAGASLASHAALDPLVHAAGLRAAAEY